MKHGGEMTLAQGDAGVMIRACADNGGGVGFPGDSENSPEEATTEQGLEG